MATVTETSTGRGADDWRGLLRDHARAAFLGLPAASAGAAEEARQNLDRQLGPLAVEALQIVEAFAIGARARSEGGGVPDSVPPEFEARLDIILNGFAPGVLLEEPTADGAPHIIQSELWQLLYKVRESAELSYAREIDLVELDRRILLLLRAVGPLVPADIAGSAGVDKAQVSRSVKRLLEIKVVERDQIRSPICLSRKGKVLSERLLRLAEMRNRELTFGIADDELARFSAVIEKLLQRAVTLYDLEQARGAEEGTSLNPFPIDPASETGQPLLLDRTRIISPLMTLSAYFSRSGALTFKRLTGLSNFETWVLNEIGRDAPVDWNTLVDRLDRDHSQAGRTVKALIARALVERQGKPGRRHGRFNPTPEGWGVFNLILEASRQRSAFLMAPLSPEQRERFLATFEKVHRNAAVQLERERTFDELASR